jgi:hypothetical protein
LNPRLLSFSFEEERGSNGDGRFLAVAEYGRDGFRRGGRGWSGFVVKLFFFLTSQ